MKDHLLPSRLLAPLAFLLIAFLSGHAASETSKILIIVGPSNHPPGTHEVAAGGRLLKHSLENAGNLPGIEASVHHEWPSDKALLEQASTVVFIGDTFPLQDLPDTKKTLAELGSMMRRGCGIVCVHYATGLKADDVAPNGDHPLLRWLGGYFAAKCPHHQSIAKIYPEATIEPANPKHPVWNGCQAFTIHDEPYINNYFGHHGNRMAKNVTALATSMLPPEDPKKETVAWCVERADKGRGFGIVMPHFYKNWKNEDLRRFILNGIAWTARRDIPKGGVRTKSPDLEAFGALSIEPKPRKPQTAKKQ